LQIDVKGDQVFAARDLDTCENGRVLPKICGKLDDANPGISRLNCQERFQGPVAGPIIHVNDFDLASYVVRDGSKHRVTTVDKLHTVKHWYDDGDEHVTPRKVSAQLRASVIVP